MKRTGIHRLTPLAFFVFLILAQSAAAADQDFEPRPIPLGTSGGNLRDSSRSFCCSGTLGSLVQDSNSVQYILSNNHVLAKTNRGVVGDAIIQPGLIDQDPACFKDTADAVSNLSDFVPLSFRRNRPNHVDAAIAEVEPGMVDPSGSILNIGQVSNVVTAPLLGMAVKKNGRTTGLTFGTVTALDVTVDVQYDRACGLTLLPQTARFTGQVMIGASDFSSGGDSGSLIVENCSSHPSPVALLFAGNGTNTVANPIGEVLSELGVSIVGTNDTCSPSQAGALNTAAPLVTVNRDDVDHAIQVKRRNEANILRMHRNGVHGIGVGYRGPDQTVIEIYVKNASVMKRLLPETMEDVPVKIVETNVFVAY